MKARVKANYYASSFKEGEIVEIIPNMEADAADVFNVPAGMCFLCKREDGTLKYIIATNLQLLASEDDPDYWTRLEHQTAIAAMQGMFANPQDYGTSWNVMANYAFDAARTLVEKYKMEE